MKQETTSQINIIRIIIVVFLIGLLSIVIYFQITSEEDVLCGDDVCQIEENCSSCPADCGCGARERCDLGQCVDKPYCGDTKCGSGENCNTCLIDCPCDADEICLDNACVQFGDCGDGECTGAENCVTCEADCGCADSQRCHDILAKCVADSYCGNFVCEGEENCNNCPTDCGCARGMYCTETECVKPTCGNGECELFEDSLNCCTDCPCRTYGMFCNTETKACVYPEPELTYNEARQRAFDYYESRGYGIVRAVVDRVIFYQDVSGRLVVVELENESHPRALYALDDGRDIEMDTI